MSVFGRSAAGKPAKYIFEPARASPSGSLTTKAPAALTLRPKSSPGLNASTSALARPTLGLLRKNTTSHSAKKAASREARVEANAWTNEAVSEKAPETGRTTSAMTPDTCPCDSASADANATSCPRRYAANARWMVV